MATRPSKFPEWATTIDNDPTSLQDNRVEPSAGQKITGIIRVAFQPRQWTNWLFWLSNAWHEHFDASVNHFDPHEAVVPDMTVLLTAGKIQNGTTLTSVAAQTSAVITAPVTDPRIDRIVIDNATGVISIIAGAEAGSPVAPALTIGKIAVAQVLLQTASTEITNSMITDERGKSFSSLIDEDNMVSDSVDFAPTQQSSKAYTDNIIDGTAGPKIQSAAYGAGSVDQAAIGASAVGQGELKTTTGEVSTTSLLYVSLTIAGGSYALYPQIKETGAGLNARLQDDFGTQPGASYVTRMSLAVITSGTAYAQSRYIQASPPYNEGDGDIPLFVFATVKSNGEIESMYVAPEAPWHYNGETDIRATRKDKISGKSWRKCSRIQYEKYIGTFTGSLIKSDLTPNEITDILDDEKEYEIELTQAIKNRDKNIIPHPFSTNDNNGKTVIMLDPVSDITEQLLRLHDSGEDVNEIIHDGYITFGNSPIARVTPKQVMCVDLNWKLTG